MCIYFRISGCLEEILNTCEIGDTILLSEGRYPIKHSSGLEERGTIIGIGNAENTILYPKESDILSSLLNFSGSEVLIK